MFRITHPRPQPGRQRALGVEFRDGVADVDQLHPEREAALRQHGFTVEDDTATVDLESLSKAELRDIAAGHVDVPDRATKAEIIAALRTGD